DGGDHWVFHQFGSALHVGLSYFLSVDEGWTLCPTTAGCVTGTGPADDYTLYHTTDSGSHWETLGHGFASSSVIPDYGLVFTDRNHGFIGTYSGDGLARLLVTADGGRKWQLVQVPAAVDAQPN